VSYIGNQPTQVAFLTDSFSGDGTTTAFSLSASPANPASIIVVVHGLTQDPTTYSISGNTLNFSGAPPAGTGNISVRYMGIPASGVTTTAYRTLTEFTATAGQTTFTPPSYTVGFISVFKNGVRLGSADFTATNGTSVVLVSAASAGDLIATESFYVSSVLNAIPNTANAVNQLLIADGAISQSKLATNVASNGPAFHAYASSTTSVSAGVGTKVTFDSESFDTNNNFASSRFTPTVAGYYMCVAQVQFGSTAYNIQLQFVKNGSVWMYGPYPNVGSGQNSYNQMSGLVYLNGSTDYLEIYVYQASGSTATVSANGIGYTYFQGFLARSA
jgi:hypothetical protein